MQIEVYKKLMDRIPTSVKKLDVTETKSKEFSPASFEAEMQRIAEDIKLKGEEMTDFDVLNNSEKAGVAAAIVQYADDWIKVMNDFIAKSYTKSRFDRWKKRFDDDINSISVLGRQNIDKIVQSAVRLRDELLTEWILALYCLAKRFRNREYSIKAKELQKKLRALPKPSYEKIKTYIRDKKKEYQKKEPSEIVNVKLIPKFKDSVEILGDVISCLEDHKQKILTKSSEEYKIAQNICSLEHPLKSIIEMMKEQRDLILNHNRAAEGTFSEIHQKAESILSEIEISQGVRIKALEYIEGNSKILREISAIKATAIRMHGDANRIAENMETSVKTAQIGMVLKQFARIIAEEQDFLDSYLQWWTTDELERFSQVFG
ncbi:MAG TPA: hypothetical protein PKN02_10795 [Thermotogota bacterium]|nr:hypothetical protein [Thermotogota bacterium]